jgi:flagellar protein FlaG
MKIENVTTMQAKPIPVEVAELRTKQATSSSSSEKKREVKEQAPVQQEDSQKESRRVNADDVKEALKEMNEKMSQMNHSIQFSVNESTKDIVVKVIDASNGEVIQQIPAEEVLKFRERMQDVMAGLLVEKTV